MKIKNYILALFVLGILLIGCTNAPPILGEYYPTVGPPETLITVKGSEFIDITKINFNDDVPANFNPSYGSEQAILFRVPLNAPLGDNMIEIETAGGSLQLPFKVTLEAPILTAFYPASAPIGETVTFLGENFFEPLEVLFHDSITAEILFASEDSLVVKVPEGTQKGFIKIKANGGDAETNKNFFATRDILINDFDGNGLHEDVSKWLFYGTINENAFNAVHSANPDPFNGSFLKLSGNDASSIWLGGTEHASFDPTVFDKYDISSDINNTFLEFQANSNGKTNTEITLVMKQREGSFNDFTETIKIDWEGWKNVSLPLNRFTDVDGVTIDPSDIKVVKVHLVNPDQLSDNLEVNIDELKFIEVL